MPVATLETVRQKYANYQSIDYFIKRNEQHEYKLAYIRVFGGGKEGN